MLRELYVEAKELLDERRETLDRVAEALLERETLGTQELDALVAGELLPPLTWRQDTPKPGQLLVVGANIPGKARVWLTSPDSAPVMRAKRTEVAANGYEGFLLQ